jgi:hypothetical protein
LFYSQNVVDRDERQSNLTKHIDIINPASGTEEKETAQAATSSEASKLCKDTDISHVQNKE